MLAADIHLVCYINKVLTASWPTVDRVTVAWYVDQHSLCLNLLNMILPISRVWTRLYPTCILSFLCSNLMPTPRYASWFRKMTPTLCKVLKLFRIMTLHVHSSFQNFCLSSSELGVSCSTPMSSNHTLLTSLSRMGSVKRKRSEVTNSSVVNSSTDSDQMEKKRRKDPVVRSGSSTPASPQVRRARGEQLILPR